MATGLVRAGDVSEHTLTRAATIPSFNSDLLGPSYGEAGSAMSLYGASVEYGIHCLLHLVDLEDGVWLSAKDVAEFQGVPSPYVAKLFTRLKESRIVLANEGVHGGFRLARDPAQISISDVIEALEGDKQLFHCREVRSWCVLHEGNPPRWATAGMCELHAAMIAAEQVMRRELRTVTLRTLTAGVAAKVPKEFGERAHSWFANRQAHRRARGDTHADAGEPGQSQGERS